VWRCDFASPALWGSTRSAIASGLLYSVLCVSPISAAELAQLQRSGDPATVADCGGRPVTFNIATSIGAAPQAGSYLIMEYGLTRSIAIEIDGWSASVRAVDADGDGLEELVIEHRIGDYARRLDVMRLEGCTAGTDEPPQVTAWLEAESDAGCFVVIGNDAGHLTEVRALQRTHIQGVPAFDTDVYMFLGGSWRRIGADVITEDRWVDPWECAGLERPEGV
jgi:hypothetical protein